MSWKRQKSLTFTNVHSGPCFSPSHISVYGHLSSSYTLSPEYPYLFEHFLPSSLMHTFFPPKGPVSVTSGVSALLCGGWPNWDEGRCWATHQLSDHGSPHVMCHMPPYLTFQGPLGLWQPRLSDYPVGYYGVVLLHPSVWQASTECWVCSWAVGSAAIQASALVPVPFIQQLAGVKCCGLRFRAPLSGPIVVLDSNHIGMCLINISVDKIHCGRQSCR